MEQNKGDETQSLQRLKRLSDGIFMLAMTLMALQFDLPDVSAEMSTKEIKEFLIAQIPALYIYLGTFILIAFYWFSNLQQFNHYKKTDTVHLWLNLLSLMFLVLIPYTIVVSLINPTYWEWSFFLIFPLYLIL